MRAIAVLAAALACAPSVLGASLKCRDGRVPHCCADVTAGASDADIVLAAQCKKVPFGHKFHCSDKKNIKVCCDSTALDLFGAGLVTLCRLPNDLNSQLGTLGLGTSDLSGLQDLLGLLGGGGLPGLPGGGGIPGIPGLPVRDLHEEVEVEE